MESTPSPGGVRENLWFRYHFMGFRFWLLAEMGHWAVQMFALIRYGLSYIHLSQKHVARQQGASQHGW